MESFNNNKLILITAMIREQKQFRKAVLSILARALAGIIMF